MVVQRPQHHYLKLSYPESCAHLVSSKHNILAIVYPKGFFREFRSGLISEQNFPLTLFLSEDISHQLIPFS